MENGKIADSQITASSQWDSFNAPFRARLNNRLVGNMRGGWSSRYSDLKQWLQVDLGNYRTVTGVATQGRADEYHNWVTRFRLQYSDDGSIFHFYHEPRDTSAKVYPSV